MKKTIRITMVLAFSLMLFACKSNSENLIKRKILENNNNIEKINSLTINEKYKDSFRGPQDYGTTYIVSFNYTLKNNTTKNDKYQVFIADKDGWSDIRNANMWGVEW